MKYTKYTSDFLKDSHIGKENKIKKQNKTQLLGQNFYKTQSGRHLTTSYSNHVTAVHGNTLSDFLS